MWFNLDMKKYTLGLLALAIVLVTATYLSKRSTEPVSTLPSLSSEREQGSGIDNQDIYPYDLSKVTNPYNKDLNESVGVVKNQVYIFSSTLKEQDLRAIVANYRTLTVLGYEAPFGLLVQFDDTSSVALQDIENIRKTPGIVDVFNNVHQGKNYDGAL